MKVLSVVSCSAVLAGAIAAVSAQPAAKSNPLRVSEAVC